MRTTGLLDLSNSKCSLFTKTLVSHVNKRKTAPVYTGAVIFLMLDHYERSNTAREALVELFDVGESLAGLT